MSALDELGDMIREQQQLRDRTFRQGQDQRRSSRASAASAASSGQQGPAGSARVSRAIRQYGELRQNQQALREQLEEAARAS